jgi:hypothetical protein
LFSVVFLKQSNICLSLPASTILFCRSADGTTPLHVAATWGDSASLHFLLLNGGDPYVRDQVCVFVLLCKLKVI